MAETELIDRYVEQLRRRLRRHRDVEELAEEVADHLHESTQRWRRLGHGSREAQHRTLAAFGDHDLVARTYAQERRRGLAVPTRQTSGAGMLLIAGAAGCSIGAVLLVMAAVADRTRPWEELPRTLYVPGSWMLTLALMAIWVGLVGLYRRHGGGGAAPTTALVLIGLGGVASLVDWFFFGWVPLLAAGCLLLAVWLRDRDIAPRIPVLLLGTGPLLAGIGVAAAAARYGATWPDDAYPAVRAGLLGALGLFAAGAAMLGQWLRSEVPVDDTEGPLLA